MDTVRDENLWTSLKNLYYQQRRWAWGAENIPYLLWEFKKHPLISFWKKFILLWHEWEGKWSWGVVAILITFWAVCPCGSLARKCVRALCFLTRRMCWKIS